MPHLQHALSSSSRTSEIWELLADNWYNCSAADLAIMCKIREHSPVTVHSVGLSLGSNERPEAAYVESLRRLVEMVEPDFVSDHASFSRANGAFIPDLLPLPFNEEAAHVLARNIMLVQDTLKRTICLENVSRYVDFKASDMTEWEFLNLVTKKSGCELLVDINNLYVNERNTGANAAEFLKNIGRQVVAQFHVSGHFDKGAFCIDDHGQSVCEEVWKLVAMSFECVGPRTTIVEWDQDLPTFDVLMSEVQQVRSIASDFGGVK